jgi:molecular chaperone DnaK
LDDTDIKRMVRDAEANAESDKKRRAFVEGKNHADALIHQMEKILVLHADTLPAGVKDEAQAGISAARSAMGGDDHDGLKQATDRLSELTIKLEQVVDKAQAAASGSPGGDPPAGAAAGEKVVDAEFEDVGGNKKSA